MKHHLSRLVLHSPSTGAPMSTAMSTPMSTARRPILLLALLLTLTGVGALTLTGCKPDQLGTILLLNEDGTPFTGSMLTLDFTAEGGVQRIDFVAQDVWAATVLPLAQSNGDLLKDWIAVDRVSGSLGKNGTTVTVEPNTLAEPRTAFIVLSCMGKSKYFTVFQAPGPVAYAPADTDATAATAGRLLMRNSATPQRCLNSRLSPSK